jgi:hypothetical protein
VHPIKVCGSLNALDSRRYEIFQDLYGFPAAVKRGLRDAAELVGSLLRSWRSVAVDLGRLSGSKGFADGYGFEAAIDARQHQAV